MTQRDRFVFCLSPHESPFFDTEEPRSFQPIPFIEDLDDDRVIGC
jgi:hypothetical protein